MGYAVTPETYTRCHIQTGLSALARSRPDWREALEAVAVLFNVEVEAPGAGGGSVVIVVIAGSLASIPTSLLVMAPGARRGDDAR